MRKFFVFSTFCIIVPLVFILSFNSHPTSQANSNKTITILLDWTPNTNHTGIFVAKNLGYFKEEGLDVKIEQPPHESSTALVAAGKVEFSIAFQDFLAPALVSDTPLPIKAIAAIAQHNTSGIVCKKSANIQNFSMLEFKNYSTFDNFIELALLKYCVEKNSGNFRNVNLVHAQIDNIAAALGTNIDAAWGYFGIESVIADHFNIENNFLFYRDVDPVLDFYTPVLISNLNFIQNNPEIIRKTLRALSKGYSFAAKFPEKAAKILVNCVPELNFDIILESQKFMSTQYICEASQWGKIDPLRWNAFFDWLFDEKIITKPIPHNSSFTNDFLPII